MEYTAAYWKRWLTTHLVWLVPVLVAFAIYALGQAQSHQPINWDLLWSGVVGAVIAQLRLLQTQHDLAAPALIPPPKG